MKHNLERSRRSKSKKLAARSFAPGRSVYRSNRTVSRSLPPLLVFRVRFDRDHEAWRSCVCHSMTPGSKDRSATPPRTCTLQLCSSCKAAPLCSAPLRSFPSRDARLLGSRSQPPFRSLCCPLCSPRLASCPALCLCSRSFAKRRSVERAYNVPRDVCTFAYINIKCILR